MRDGGVDESMFVEVLAAVKASLSDCARIRCDLQHHSSSESRDERVKAFVKAGHEAMCPADRSPVRTRHENETNCWFRLQHIHCGACLMTEANTKRLGIDYFSLKSLPKPDQSFKELILVHHHVAVSVARPMSHRPL